MKKRVIGSVVVFIIVCLTLLYTLQTICPLLEIKTDLVQLLIISAAIGFIAALFMLIHKKKRDFQDIEYGSTQWGDINDLNGLRDKSGNNIILSQNIQLDIDTRKTQLNNHTLVIGGSGTGKSFNFVKPNILQMNQSYVITDPKGEHYAAEAEMLRQNGYAVKKFDIVDFKTSMNFNPLIYFEEIKDVKRFVTLLMDNTTGDDKKADTNDFWAKAEKLWMMSVLSYIMETCDASERNMNSVVALLDASEARDEDEEYVSAADLLFSDLERDNPQSFAARQYKKYKKAAGKTAKSILISLGVRLADFDIPEIRTLVSEDELDLSSLGDKKTALFIIIDDMDTTYNYLAAILISTLFQVLKRYADSMPNQRLTIPVAFFLDEIANIGFFRQLHIIMSVIRSRGISMFLIFQAISQGKAIYKDNWETIEGNCDNTVFLGGKGESTQKYVSDTVVGKATIDTKSTGGSGTGKSLGYSSYNYNEQKAGRNLIDMNEVARLDNSECIVSIRGFQPFKDKKYKTQNHKNFNQLNSPVSDTTKNEVSDREFFITDIDLEEVL